MRREEKLGHCLKCFKTDDFFPLKIFNKNIKVLFKRLKEIVTKLFPFRVNVLTKIANLYNLFPIVLEL